MVATSLNGGLGMSSKGLWTIVLGGASTVLVALVLFILSQLTNKQQDMEDRLRSTEMGVTEIKADLKYIQRDMSYTRQTTEEMKNILDGWEALVDADKGSN